MFETRAGQTCLHEFCSGAAQDHFAMGVDVIGMGVAYEDAIWTGLGKMWIEPKAKRGQENAAFVKFKLEHALKLRRAPKTVNCCGARGLSGHRD